MIKELEFAAKMLEIEAHCAMTRANMLMKNDKQCILHIQEITKKIKYIAEECLNPEETKFYLAKQIMNKQSLAKPKNANSEARGVGISNPQLPSYNYECLCINIRYSI